VDRAILIEPQALHLSRLTYFARSSIATEKFFSLVFDDFYKDRIIHYQLDNLMHHIQPSPSEKVVDNSRLNRLHSTLATPGRGDNASPSTAVIDSDCNAYSGILNHQQGRAIDYTSPAYALCHGGRTADPHSCTCSNKNACDPIFRLPLAAMQVTG
jgi:hypothetical protein